MHPSDSIDLALQYSLEWVVRPIGLLHFFVIHKKKSIKQKMGREREISNPSFLHFGVGYSFFTEGISLSI